MSDQTESKSQAPVYTSSLPAGSSSEVRSLDLNSLMSTDPLNLTQAHLDEMISRMREARKNWAAEELAAKSQGRKPKSSAANIGLNDLDLDI